MVFLSVCLCVSILLGKCFFFVVSVCQCVGRFCVVDVCPCMVDIFCVWLVFVVVW